MTDRNDRSTERRPAEGVRIIGADEAQAALEAGQVAGRLTEEEPRYGDVPPAPTGPRPAHRFPLPDSVPAEAVPRPPVAPLPRPPVVRAPRASEVAGATRSGQRVADPPASAPGGGGVEPGELDVYPADPRSGSVWRPQPGRARPGQQRARGRGAPPPPSPEVDGEGDWGDEGRAGIAGRPLGEPDVGSPAPSGGPLRPGAASTAGAPSETDPTGRVPVVHPEDMDLDDMYHDDMDQDSMEADGIGRRASADPGAGAGGWSLDVGSGTAGPDPVAPIADEPLSPAPPGSGLRWATPVDEAQWSAEGAPVVEAGPEAAPPAVEEATMSEGSSWSAAGSEDRGSLGWDSGPDDPTAVQPAIPADPPIAIPADPPIATPDEADRDAGRGRAFLPPAPPGGITVWGGSELPHWTDPPTGEVPISLAGLGPDGPAAGESGARWRRGAADWDDGGIADDLGDDELPLGALDQDRSEESDLFSFDEDFERLEDERIRARALVAPEVPADDGPDLRGRLGALGEEERDLVGAGLGARRQRERASRSGALPVSDDGGDGRPSARRPAAPGDGAGARNGTGRDVPADLSSRLGVGIGLAVVLIAAYFLGAGALVGLVALCLLGAAAEGFTMLRESSGFRPATLVGLLATGGLVLGAWWKGEGALPLVLAVATVATMLWYLLGVSEARPLANVMATLTVVMWVGLLGSFAGLLLRADHGRGLFFAVAVTVVLADVVAYFVGRRIGSRKLAPRVSPGKTVEGFVAGGVAALVVGAVVGNALPGWGGVGHGLLLGLVVAVFAPIGDLFESLIKRDLDVKDSGRLLAGHGGLLDRFDSVILVLPAAYYLAVALHLA